MYDSRMITIEQNRSRGETDILLVSPRDLSAVFDEINHTAAMIASESDPTSLYHWQDTFSLHMKELDRDVFSLLIKNNYGKKAEICQLLSDIEKRTHRLAKDNSISDTIDPFNTAMSTLRAYVESATPLTTLLTDTRSLIWFRSSRAPFNDEQIRSLLKNHHAYPYLDRDNKEQLPNVSMIELVDMLAAFTALLRTSIESDLVILLTSPRELSLSKNELSMIEGNLRELEIMTLAGGY